MANGFKVYMPASKKSTSGNKNASRGRAKKHSANGKNCRTHPIISGCSRSTSALALSRSNSQSMFLYVLSLRQEESFG